MLCGSPCASSVRGTFWVSVQSSKHAVGVCPCLKTSRSQVSTILRVCPSNRSSDHQPGYSPLRHREALCRHHRGHWHQGLESGARQDPCSRSRVRAQVPCKHRVTSKRVSVGGGLAQAFCVAARLKAVLVLADGPSAPAHDACARQGSGNATETLRHSNGAELQREGPRTSACPPPRRAQAREFLRCLVLPRSPSQP
jgi:hypothetical protein